LSVAAHRVSVSSFLCSLSSLTFLLLPIGLSQ
jgi:hypothetical protein